MRTICRDIETEYLKKGFNLIAGVDESGRGPLAGPVVAAAVILKERLFEARIDDCKLLTPDARKTAFIEIRAKAHIGIGVISETEIDSINIYNATKRAIIKAVKALPLKPDILLVDGRFNSLSTAIPYKCLIKGDTFCQSISAASIVAKYVRDSFMKDYHSLMPEYGFSDHKGYATKAHRNAIQKIGRSSFHRNSFMTGSEETGAV